MIDAATLDSFKSNPKTLWGGGYLGSGAFGEVSPATIPGYVVKTVNDFARDGWWLWMVFSLVNAGWSPMLPKIAAVTVDIESETLHVLMEQLDHSGQAEFRRKFISWSGQAPSMCDDEAVALEEEYPGLAQLICDAHDQMFGHVDDLLHMDLHSANVMWRGDQIVITDPFILVDEEDRDWICTGDGHYDSFLDVLDVFGLTDDPRVHIIRPVVTQAEQPQALAA